MRSAGAIARAFFFVLVLLLVFGARAALADERHGELIPESPGAGAGEHAEEAGGDSAEHYHPLDIRALFVQFLGFAILAAILGYFVVPSLAEALGARREKIRATFDGLERDRREAVEGAKAAEQQLSQAERTSIERIEQARREGGELREALVAEADEAAAKIVQKARTEAQIERAKMLLELRNEVVDVGFRAAESVIRATMDRETQSRLVERFLDDLDAVRRT
jgi:F-type H+-transporting ATPase subunit b